VRREWRQVSTARGSAGRTKLLTAKFAKNIREARKEHLRRARRTSAKGAKKGAAQLISDLNDMFNVSLIY
jgi:hypothetical protein